jgi:hypothetical protein
MARRIHPEGTSKMTIEPTFEKGFIVGTRESTATTPPAMNAASPTEALLPKFEAWAKEPIRADKLPLEQHPNGAYKDQRSYSVYYGWKSGYEAALAEQSNSPSSEPVGYVKDHFAGTPKAYRTVVWADRTFAMDVPDGALLYAAPVGQGSATSGEASVETQVMQEFLKWNRSQSAPPVAIPKELFVARKVLNLRAALAASAKQSNTPVPRMGGNTSEYKPYCAYCDEDRDEPCGAPSCGVAGDFATVADRAAAPASAPEPIPTTDDYTLDDVDLARKLLTFLGYSISPSREPGAEWRVDKMAGIIGAWNDAKAAAPEVAQPAAQCESIDKPEFRKLSYAYAEALMRGTIPQTSAAWEALVDFCNAWGASQRQEGRRDMHETNVALVNENCALVERLWALTGAKCEYPHCGCDNRASCSVKARALATPTPTAGEPSAAETVGACTYCDTYLEQISQLDSAIVELEGRLLPHPTSEQVARSAIDGAIAYGRIGINPPPSPGHWLNEYWQIGRQLAKLGETSAWDNVTPIDSPDGAEATRSRAEGGNTNDCEACSGTEVFNGEPCGCCIKATQGGKES